MFMKRINALPVNLITIKLLKGIRVNKKSENVIGNGRTSLLSGMAFLNRTLFSFGTLPGY